MKLTGYLSLCLGILLLASCSSEQDPIDNDSVTPVIKIKKTITATISSSTTRTALGAADANGNYSPVWSEGDQIGVFFNGAGSAVPFTLISGAGTNTAVFEGADGGSSYQAFYPYEIIGPISNGSISITLPSSQVYTEGTFAPDAFPMLSSVTTDNGGLVFSNLMSVAKVSLTGSDMITGLSFESNDTSKKLSGEATVNLETKIVTVTGSNSVAMTLPSAGITLSDEPTDFYMVIPAQTYSNGFKLIVSAENSSTIKETTSAVVFAGSVLREVSAEIEFVNGINIPDPNFKAYILENFDTNTDGILTQEEADLITRIEVPTNNIESIEGIEYFTNLQELLVNGTYQNGAYVGKLTSLDVSSNLALTNLECSNNKLTNLDVSMNTALRKLWCSGNSLTSLNVSKNLYLENLDFAANQLTSLDVSKNTELYYLNCYRNQLSSLDVSNNIALINLEVDTNQLTSLDVSNNTALTQLSCGRNQLTSLDVSKNTELIGLLCDVNQLTSLDVSKNVTLSRLLCNNNQLTSLDVSKNTTLSQLTCNDNQISEIVLSIGQSMSVTKDETASIVYVANGQIQQVTTGEAIEL